jgi:hypothetical protein
MFQVCAELSALKSLITGLTNRSCKSWGIQPAVTPGTSSLGGIVGVFREMLAASGLRLLHSRPNTGASRPWASYIGDLRFAGRSDGESAVQV